MTLPERPPLTRPPIRQSRLPIPRRARLILHKTGSGRPGVAAGDARTPCPPGCRQDGQGRPQPGFLCAEYTGQKGEVGSRVTGRSGQHLPLPSPTVPPALPDPALSSNLSLAISQLHDFGQRSSQHLCFWSLLGSREASPLSLPASLGHCHHQPHFTDEESKSTGCFQTASIILEDLAAQWERASLRTYYVLETQR